MVELNGDVIVEYVAELHPLVRTRSNTHWPESPPAVDAVMVME